MNKKVKLLVLGYITVAQFAALSSNSIVFAKDLNERSKAEIMDNMSEEVIYFNYRCSSACKKYF